MEKASSKATDDFHKNKKKILIVDDDETILYILKRFFVGRGFQVWVAKDGFEAMERLKAEKPALVLTDIKMPSFSGIDLIKFIRQNMKDVPIIVMTAFPHLYPEKRNENEVEAYYVKPFDIDEMFLSIERILGG
ncbi:MAG: response regulator [Thermodesulfobacteriota bacterium]|nr:response regulator [Thermodesulfobacteriota bacterium]